MKETDIEEKLAQIDADDSLSTAEKQIARQELEKKLKKHEAPPAAQKEKQNPESVPEPKPVTKRKSHRKTLLIVIAALLAATLIAFGLVKLLDRPAKEKEHDPYSGLRAPEGALTYVWATETVNTQTDPGYLALDRTVRYYDPDFGMTRAIEEDHLEDFDEAVIFLYAWIQTMVTGDVKNFNDCFSPRYLEAEGRIDDFTETAIYGATISKCADAAVKQYEIEFMVYQNNGSLINRVDSDAAKPFYVVLTGTGSSMKIDRLFYPHYVIQ